jgi:hypothetical protein
VVVIGLVSYTRAADSCCNYTKYCPYNWQCEKNVLGGGEGHIYVKIIERYNIQLCKGGGEFQTCSEDDYGNCCKGKKYACPCGGEDPCPSGCGNPCVQDNYLGDCFFVKQVTDYDEVNACCI